MIRLRAASARGHADHGWLRTWHSFSFADYHDPRETGWGPLRVLNEDIVAPGRGFAMHGHRDMEIVTVVLAGALAHRDSLGNGATLRPGEVQRMSAGSGIRHSESNPSPDEPLHLLQIWLQPAAVGGAPTWEQRAVGDGGETLLASPDGRDGSVRIGLPATLTRLRLAAGERRTQRLAGGRIAYAHVVSGALAIDAVALAAGDGARIADAAALQLAAGDGGADLLWFDLPAATLPSSTPQGE